MHNVVKYMLIAMYAVTLGTTMRYYLNLLQEHNWDQREYFHTLFRENLRWLPLIFMVVPAEALTMGYRTLGKGMMFLYLNGDVILSAVSRAEMEKYDVLPKHLDGIVNQLRVTKDIKVAVFLYENEDGTYKGSLRVNGDYDVAKVASVFGGGGHVKAAGFTIDGPLEVATDRILTAIKDNI